MRLHPKCVTMLLVLATVPAMAGPVKAPGGFVPQHAIAYGAADSEATAVDAAHPLPVVAQAAAAAYTDRSGSIASGGTAQAIAPARADRRGFFIQNLSSAELWIGFGTNATTGAGALRIAAGQLYESPAHGSPAGAISVIGATTGQSFTAKEW